MFGINELEERNKLSDEDLINTLLKVVESQNNIIQKMIQSRMEEKSRIS